MGLLIKLGFKNIGRNRMRSILTIAAVVFCAGGVTFYSVIFSGVMDMVLRELMNQTGHLRLMHQKVIEKERLYAGQYFVPNADHLMKEIQKISGVRAVVPRIQLGAYIDHNGKQAPAQGMGIIPAREQEIWHLHKKMVKGRMLQSGKKEVVLGYRLAKRLGVIEGSEIVLLGKTVDDSMSALRLKVVGLMHFGTAVYDKMFFVSLSTAQYLLDLKGQVSTILVFLPTLWRTDGIKKDILKLHLPKDIVPQRWQETPFASMMLPMASAMLFIMGGIIILIGGVGLLNTLMMSVFERRAEIGVMMAMGMTPFRIALIFLFEGVVFGVVGAFVGVSLACLGSIPLITKGMSFGSDVTAKIPFPIAEHFKGTLTIEGIVIGLVVGILATVVGAIWPAFKASRLNPIEALHS